MPCRWREAERCWHWYWRDECCAAAGRRIGASLRIVRSRGHQAGSRPMAGKAPACRDRSALVLCGGGSHGALEVGFARALYEAGHRPYMILGTSIGALNGAFLAAGVDVATLEGLWRVFRSWKALRPNWGWLLHPRTAPGFLNLTPLRRILQRELPVTRFEELTIPLSIVTTDLASGKACYWEGEGDLMEPLLASMSLPGVFPQTELDGRLHVDGGIHGSGAGSGAVFALNKAPSNCPGTVLALSWLGRGRVDRAASIDLSEPRRNGP